MHVKGTEGMLYEAERFVRSLAPREDGATVVTLRGELGAGKTAFVKGVARALGVTEHVTSPTFVIMKIYPIRDAVRSNEAGPQSGHFKRLVHIDAYRLKGAHHLKVLGWEELLREPATLICIEWPEQAQGAIPPHAIKISLRYTGDDEREINYEKDAEAVGTA